MTIESPFIQVYHMFVQHKGWFLSSWGVAIEGFAYRVADCFAYKSNSSQRKGGNCCTILINT